MGKYKAKETFYSSIRFRSRLEARWAVFFDTLGVRYKYEMEGFECEDDNGNRCSYLPDFYLPDLHCFVEVKGAETFGDISDYDKHKMRTFVGSGASEGGLIILGDIPAPNYDNDYGDVLLIFALSYEPDGVVEWLHPCYLFDEELHIHVPAPFHDGIHIGPIALGAMYDEDVCRSLKVRYALTKARSARFEFNT